MSKRATKAPQYEEVLPSADSHLFKKQPGRLQLWLRYFGTSVAWYGVPLITLAVLAGPTRSVGVPFQSQPRPLLVVALALALGTAVVAHLHGWYATRRAAR